MPGNFDDFIVQVGCPACGKAAASPYGLLRRDPRLSCGCGLEFAVYLSGSPVETADLGWDLRGRTANDNRPTPVC